MLRYMLDAIILIYTIRQKPDVVRKRFEAHDGEMCVSSITAMELLYGAHKSQAVRDKLEIIEGLLGRLKLIDSDLAAAEHAGQIRAELAAAQAPIGPFDVMIAGHARSRCLNLVTNNEGEFSRVRGLFLENWSR
jgi:tRNA(fMet)-specific endonuclease VapC